MVKIHNIYSKSKCRKGLEVVRPIIDSKKFKIETIISNGYKDRENFWHYQKDDEFVLLLQGKAILSFEKGIMLKLKKGDYIVIPKKTKHRIEYTSSKPGCLWLTAFGKFL